MDNDVAVAILSNLGASCFAVYCILRLHAGGDTLCYPSLTTICKESGMSRATVCRSVAELKDAGVIQSTKSPGHVTHYELALPEAICNQFKNETSINLRLPDPSQIYTTPVSKLNCYPSQKQTALVSNLNSNYTQEQDSLNKTQELERGRAHVKPPSWKVFSEHAGSTGVDLVTAELCWNHYEVKGWPNNGARWDLLLKSWVLRNYQNAQDGIPSRNGNGKAAPTYQEKQAEKAHKWAQEARERKAAGYD